MSALALLRTQIQQYKAENPRARLVDIAKALGVSEREAVTAQIEAGQASALKPDWEGILSRVSSIGPVMALTRNAYVVSECRGTYGAPQVNGKMGLVHHDNIDLRLFLQHWDSAFALTLSSPRGPLRSLQFFNAAGRAVHKIFLEGENSEEASASLIRDFHMDAGELAAPQALNQEKSSSRALTEAELEAFRSDWRKLKDTHEFHGLLRRHGLDRIQAMELAGAEFVRELSPTALEKLLVAARDTQMPLMAFVGNDGAIQIYSGLVQNLKRLGDWYNVLDPSFNLHIDERGRRRASLVKKPTRYGIVSSLEFFSPEDELVLSFFGVRKDDQMAPPAWTELLESLDAP